MVIYIHFLRIYPFSCLQFICFNFGKNFFNNEVKTLVEEKTINNYEIASVFSIVITFGFLVMAYRYFKKIDLNQSVVDLMKNIISFRRLVNLFILFTVLSLIVSSAHLLRIRPIYLFSKTCQMIST